MWKKLAIGLVVVLLGAGAIGFLNRKAVILYVATHSGRAEVAPNVPIEWDKGPDVATLPAADRPPNIVFILVDDLGINDLSTFGGGVAGGRVPTPNIDRLAADGALFTQAYAGNGTCAPSRAMLMTWIAGRFRLSITIATRRMMRCRSWKWACRDRK